MGCGPLLRRQTACTNVTANLRSKRPAFHTPSVAFGDTFPASRRRGRPAAACRLDDLCERRRAKGAASRPRRQLARNRSLAGLFKGLGAKNCNFRALAPRPFGPNPPPRPDTRCCRFEASGAIVFPGAELNISSLCGAICGPTRFAVRRARAAISPTGTARLKWSAISFPHLTFFQCTRRRTRDGASPTAALG